AQSPAHGQATQKTEGPRQEPYLLIWKPYTKLGRADLSNTQNCGPNKTMSAPRQTPNADP
ncbi:MAG: hypothetical protein ACP5HD_10790, partial [Thermoproteus sp.]